jgi:putative DNA-invertase from lambdoid prophage Rac
MMSANRPSPSAPIFTSLTIQATRPPLVRQQTRKYRSGPRTPKLAAVPPKRQERDLTAFAERSGYEVVGTFKETGSGMKLDRIEQRKVMALAQARRIDAVLVTELSRWGRSTTDLLATLKELEVRRVSVIALNGMAFDLATPHGRMIATVLAGIAEFERELIQERIRSGIAAAKARGKRLGRQLGQRPKSDRLTPKVLALIGQGRSYRLIGREVGLSKNTVAQIAKRNRDDSITPIV